MPQSILGRMGQLIRANVSAILDSVEDPEVMLDQLIRDYTDSIAEVEHTVAQTVGNLRLLEEDQTEAADAQREWGDKAAAASRKADEVRGQGGADADRFDELAKIALAQIQVQQAVKSVSVMDPTSELGRFEERIRRQEALAQGMEEVAATSLDEQFALLERSEDDLEVDARLAALKAGEDPLRIGSGDESATQATATAG